MPTTPHPHILISGATGLVGQALLQLLRASGATPVALIRPGSRYSGESITWNPDANQLDAASLENFDAIIHLAGENIAAGRWTPERKQRILESRTKPTTLLAKTIANLAHPPRVFICASAVGYYGDHADAVVTESTPSADTFLAQVCKQWEAACEPARSAGIRTVNLRFAMILSGKGGALPKMLTPFKLFAGGRSGSGQQWWPWIDLDDAVSAIQFSMNNQNISGPINVTAPQPLRNSDFAKTIGHVLHRPAFIPAPIPLMKLGLGGEMIDEFLLTSCRAAPTALRSAHFEFRYPTLEASLRHQLKR